MGWFGNKEGDDPLAARERELEQEIARLSQQVDRLAQEQPKAVVRPPESTPGPRSFADRVEPSPVQPPQRPSGYYNEFGVAKFDLLALIRRCLVHFRGPTSNNPRMAKMLAAGSVQGLRTLRYERRVARNRFIALFVILLLILWGLTYSYLRIR